jgi:hypothetical protein
VTFLPIDGVMSQALRGSKIRGVRLAIVIDNKDGAGNPGFRVKVKFPWLNEQESTFWVRIAIPMGGRDRGTYVLPEIDDQVLVVFEHGDINRPIVIGALWSKKQEPVEANQSGKNNTKLIKSRSGHRIIFDDEEGAEKIIIVDRTKKNKIVLDSVSKSVKIESDGDIEVIAKADVIMHSNALKIGTSEGVTGKGASLLTHSAKTFGLKATSGITIGGGNTTINVTNAAATSVSGTGSGELGGAASARAPGAGGGGSGGGGPSLDRHRGGGGGGGRPPGPPPPPTVGDIAIHVVSSTGIDLPGATVSIAGPSSATQVSGPGGFVEFRSMAPGAYSVAVTKPGYTAPLAAPTVTSRAGTSVVATVVLIPMVEVSIVVTNAATGAVVVGASVVLDGPQLTGGVTAATGKVHLEGIPVGSYDITTASNGFRDDHRIQVLASGSFAVAVPLTPLPTANPVLTVPKLMVAVRKPHTNPPRQQVRLTTNVPFGGSGTLTISPVGTIKLFTALAGGTEVSAAAHNNVFTGAQLAVGVNLFAEGAAASRAVGDVTVTLTLIGGAPQLHGPPAVVQMTAVTATLEICTSRTRPTVEPTPLTVAQQLNPGRMLHVQTPGNQHGRAKLIVHRATPHVDLEVRPMEAMPGNRVDLFDVEDPAAAGAAHAAAAAVTDAALAGGTHALFAQGKTVSGAVRDSGVVLALPGGGPELDHVVVTVVRLRNLTITVPGSPPLTARMANGPVADEILRLGTGATPSNVEYSQDYAVNVPTVLMTNSAVAPLALAVTMVPAGPAVSWEAVRDTRPAPDGDAAGVIALSPRATPTVVGSNLTATVATDAVGSFRLRAFLDENGSGAFGGGEPYILMNLVLVDTQLVADNSRSDVAGANLAANTDGAGGLVQPQGAFNINAPANDLFHANCTVDLIGGGGSGLRGTNQVFSGWLQNIPTPLDIVASYTGGHAVRIVFASNVPVAGVFLPAVPPAGPGPAPAIVATPLLDSGRPGAGQGGNSATLGSSRIRSRIPTGSLGGPPTLGERLIVEAVDSPSGFSATGTHPGLPAAVLTSFRFNLDFDANLVFWTNHARNPAATGDLADRLYVVRRRIHWRIRASWTVSPPGAVAPAPPAGTVTAVAVTTAITARTPFAPQTEVHRALIEPRVPTAVPLLGSDGRT